AQNWPGVEFNWFGSATDTVPLATSNSFFVPSVSTQNTYYLEYSSLTGSQTFTYSAGDIQSDRDFTTLPGASACPGVLTINLPVGFIVDSLDVEYDFTAMAGGWMSDQRSQLRCITTGQSETQLAVGTGSTSGTLNYKRTGLTIANGVVTGPLVFELHAGRTFGGNGCDASQNFIPNNTWKITLYYRGTPCSNVRVPVTVGIAPLPTAAFTYTISNYTVNFSGTFTDADSVYWTFGTAGSSSQQNPTFTFPQNGVYPVCVTAFNACGSTTVCDTLTFSIGISEISLQNRLKVYPNPNAGVFDVTFSDDVAELPIEVLDLSGKAVYRATWKSASGHYHERLDLQTLPAGTYMLRIHTTAGQLTRKVVIKK
ncbi:T9SS type A sorting domain-containing protein, partial [Thermaurantimonas aggregans]|uniref:T9SS type A sorting domain-containing protein n=1 Tax=Thermaurantimonas aggregans TaxID=2173829 RepID=UPI0023F08D81